ncbi:MAG: hypothetical protein PHX38_02840 [Sulfuricella sp.]|nr:hypothetical protein [Sulfuricella sp.]
MKQINNFIAQAVSGEAKMSFVIFVLGIGAAVVGAVGLIAWSLNKDMEGY